MAEAVPLGGLAVDVEVRWADTDQYGHVNNVAIARVLEEARVRLFGLPGLAGIVHPDRPVPVLTVLGDDTSTIVAAQRIEYVRELAYRGQAVTVDGWIAELGSRSITLAFRVLDPDDTTGTPLERVKATVTVVVTEAATGRPRPITSAERVQLTRHLGDPPTFR